ncbi:MAG: hypothetical protein GQ477_02440 [Nanohaloarchaea archaeon]|nr:hypothetical protein [Candidatus Nanohaloarchaea archaeon]
MILNPSCSEIVTSFKVKDIDEARNAINLISKELGINLFLTVYFTSFEVDEKNKKLILMYETPKDYLNYKTFALPFDSKHLRLRKKERFDKDRNEKIEWYEYYFDKDIFNNLIFDIDLPEILNKNLEDMTLIFKNCHIMPQFIQEPSGIIFNTKKEMIRLNANDDNSISLKELHLFNYSIDKYDYDKFPFFSKIVKMCRKSGGEKEYHYSIAFQNWCPNNNNLELITEYKYEAICFKVKTIQELRVVLKNISEYQLTLYFYYFDETSNKWELIDVDISKLKFDAKKNLIYDLPKFKNLKHSHFDFIFVTDQDFNLFTKDLESKNNIPNTLIGFPLLLYNPYELSYPFAILFQPNTTVRIASSEVDCHSYIINTCKPYFSEIRFFGDESFRKQNPTINLMMDSDEKTKNILDKIKKHLKR